MKKIFKSREAIPDSMAARTSCRIPSMSPITFLLTELTNEFDAFAAIPVDA